MQKKMQSSSKNEENAAMNQGGWNNFTLSIKNQSNWGTY
jgi:hypothetical protein